MGKNEVVGGSERLSPKKKMRLIACADAPGTNDSETNVNSTSNRIG